MTGRKQDVSSKDGGVLFSDKRVSRLQQRSMLWFCAGKRRMVMNKTIRFIAAMLIPVLLCRVTAEATDGPAGSPQETISVSDAEDTLRVNPVPYSTNDLMYEKEQYGQVNNAYLAETEEGFIRVFCKDGEIHAEYYDGDLNIVSKRLVKMELPVWGGFFRSRDAYYVVEGQPNPEEDDHAEVIRVIRYDHQWNRTGAASIANQSHLWEGRTRYPFDSSNLSMAEYNGILYIAAGHQGYTDAAYGQGHQGLLLITVEEASMTGKIVAGDYGHSFAQHLECDDTGLYMLEENEGSRCATLKRFDRNVLEENMDAMESIHSVCDYVGNRTTAWAVPTNASADGLALSDENVLTIGTSIDPSRYGEEGVYALSCNLYLTVTPKTVMTRENTTSVEDHGSWSVVTRPTHNKASEATSFQWLTDHSGENENAASVYDPKITKINDDRFLITWAQSWDRVNWPVPDPQDALSGDTLHYLFVNGDGEPVSEEFSVNATVSDCQPILRGQDVIFYSCCGMMFDFYVIDGNSGSFRKKIIRIAGENATWDLDPDGKLTISGTGMAATDAVSYGRFDLRSAEGGDWDPIRDHVVSIIFAPGITGIGDGEYCEFKSLNEIVFPVTLKSIGKRAFWGYDIDRLDSVYVPGNVSSIGDSAFETYKNFDGGSRILHCRLLVDPGSCAEQYAKDHHIFYEIYDDPSVDMPMYGDVDNDGIITVKDALAVLKDAVGAQKLDAVHIKTADVDNSGKISVRDALFILKYVVGTIDRFPVDSYFSV